MPKVYITISGKDQPGLVSDVASRIHQYGGNWESGRMINLGGRFVGLLQVSVPDDKQAVLEEAVRAIPNLDSTFAVDVSSNPLAGKRLQLDLMGADHPGIVREVFGTIAAQGLNVESISTDTEAAADSGNTLFRTTALLSYTDQTDLTDLQNALEALAQDLFVDLKILPL